MILFIILTSLFVLIPIYQFTGGLFGVITKTLVVNRLYYSSSLFILVPIIIFYFIRIYNLKFIYTNFIILILLISTFTFSKYNNNVSHNYYKNLISINNSFYSKKIGFHLNKKQIDLIGEKIKVYERKNQSEKYIKYYYYARADIAFVLKYIYNKNVFWKGRRYNPDYLKEYERMKDNSNHYHILFETPNEFPEYIPYS